MIAALMCGGMGRRLGKSTGFEKPLLRLKGKALIEWVLDALIGSQKFEKIIAIPTPNTPRTSEFLHYFKTGQIDVIETEGISYSNDLANILNKLKPATVFAVPTDLPLLNSKVIQNIILHCLSAACFPCVSVVLEKLFIQSMGMEPSIAFFNGKKEYCHSGLTLLDSAKLEEGYNLEEYYIVMNEKEIAVNVNTQRELVIARRLLCSNN